MTTQTARLAITVSAGVLCLAVPALSFRITQIPYPADIGVRATAVNAAGVVTGWVVDDYDWELTDAFIFDSTSMEMDRLDLYYTRFGEDINDHGDVVGGSDFNGDIGRAFIYDGVTSHSLGTLPGGEYSYATGINNSGQVTGRATHSLSSTEHAFLYDGGEMTDLGTLGGSWSAGMAINDSGQVTGYSPPGIDGPHAFLFDGTTMIDLGTLGGTQSWGYDINDAGWVTGSSRTDTGQYHAFIHDGTSMHDLGTLGGTGSGAQAINNRGQVIGYAHTIGAASHAFLYDDDLGGMVDLNDYIDPASGWILQSANDISANGHIVGSGNLGAFLLTPIPEPNTIVLLGMGLAGLALRSRRKKTRI